MPRKRRTICRSKSAIDQINNQAKSFETKTPCKRDTEPDPYNREQAIRLTKLELSKLGITSSETNFCVEPNKMDHKVTFEMIGGLDDLIGSLKEMFLFPILYPEMYNGFQGIKSPKGALFYGPPGTGKTMMGLALACECQKYGHDVSVFIRKGSDCLSKWVGDSENNLRTLFLQAISMQPSIIFFDEIDGLAPKRSSKQDHIYCSIVSTLLGLMDKIDNNTQVIVIGATNRIEAIDPALRRPGRFDREFLFQKPNTTARTAILNINTQSWVNQPSPELIEEMSKRTVGFSGADLKSLCSEAIFAAFRKKYPEAYTLGSRVKISGKSIKVDKGDFETALQTLSERVSNRDASMFWPIRDTEKVLLEHCFNNILNAAKYVFPIGFPKLTEGLKICRPRLLICGNGDLGQSTHLAPALLHEMENVVVFSLETSRLLENPDYHSLEEGYAATFREAQGRKKSVIYLPNFQQFCDPKRNELLFCCLCDCLNTMHPEQPTMFLAACNISYKNMPMNMRQLFNTTCAEMVEVTPSTDHMRRRFFQPLFNSILTNDLVQPSTASMKSDQLNKKLKSVFDMVCKKHNVLKSTTMVNEKLASNGYRSINQFLKDLENDHPDVRIQTMKIMHKTFKLDPSNIPVIESVHRALDCAVKLTENKDLPKIQSLYKAIHNCIKYNPSDKIQIINSLMPVYESFAKAK